VGGWKKEPSCSCEQDSGSITLPPKGITDMQQWYGEWMVPHSSDVHLFIY